MNSSCPITNLQVETRPEWSDLQVSSNYFVTFKRIGDFVLLHEPEGAMEDFDCDRYFDLRENVLRDAFKQGDKFIDIKSYEMMTGSPPAIERKKLLSYMLKEKHRCNGYIVYGLAPFIQLIFKTGILTVNKLPYPVYTVKNYSSAIQFAHELHVKASGKNKFIQTKFIQRDEWKFTSDNGDCALELMVDLEDNILFSSYTGKLNLEAFSFLEKTMGEMINERLITGGYYRIADFSRSVSISTSARKSYIDLLNSIQEKHNIYPIASYIYGAGPIFRTVLLFGQLSTGTKIVFVKDLDEAVQLARNPSKKSQKPQRVSVYDTDINRLTALISTIAWDTEKSNEDSSIDPNSPLKQVENALDIVKKDRLEFIAELQKKNEYLTRINTELAEARDSAQSANKAKGQFLANMSHELRTPLNGIIGMSEILSRTELTEEQKKFLSIVMTSSNHLLSVINDILDFSKIEYGQIHLEQTGFVLPTIIDEVIAIISPQAKDKKIPIITNCDSRIHRSLIGDPFRLRQVFLNIVQNAIKFTNDGEIKISISVEADTEFEQTVQFKIADTGIGFDPETLSKLFSQFVQADSSTTRKFGGTGLGLVISRQLVELMGGTIVVESTVGKGSIFKFSIPFKKGVSMQNISTDSVNASPLNTTDFSILLVEDVPTNQFVVRKMLEKLGFSNLTICKNGQEALNIMKEQSFDLVFMDCQMPVLDGYETTRLIRDKQTEIKNHDTIIIAFTAHALEEEVTKCYACGMNDYVLKPLTMDSLKAVLNQWAKKALPND